MLPYAIEIFAVDGSDWASFFYSKERSAGRKMLALNLGVILGPRRSPHGHESTSSHAGNAGYEDVGFWLADWKDQM